MSSTVPGRRTSPRSQRFVISMCSVDPRQLERQWAARTDAMLSVPGKTARFRRTAAAAPVARRAGGRSAHSGVRPSRAGGAGAISTVSGTVPGGAGGAHEIW